MADFPLLNTGAVTQYPLPLTATQRTQVVRFIDGSDQRFLTQGRQYRKWQIRLDLLNETELQSVEAFFDAQNGNYSMFMFPDPVTGGNVANCRLADPALITEYSGVDTGSSTFWVIETNG